MRRNALDRAVSEMLEYPFLTYVREERLIFWNEDRNFVQKFKPFLSKEKCKSLIRKFVKIIKDVELNRQHPETQQKLISL